MQDEVIEGSRAKAALLVVGSVALTAVCIFCLTLPDPGLRGRLAGWIGAPFFIIAGLAWAMQAVRPPVLTLGDQGFTQTALRGPPLRVAWADIEPLGVWTYRRTSMVTFKYLPGRRPAKLGALARMNSAFGMDGTVSTAFPIKAEALAAKMNARRAAANGASA